MGCLRPQHPGSARQDRPPPPPAWRDGPASSQMSHHSGPPASTPKPRSETSRRPPHILARAPRRARSGCRRMACWLAVVQRKDERSVRTSRPRCLVACRTRTLELARKSSAWSLPPQDARPVSDVNCACAEHGRTRGDRGTSSCAWRKAAVWRRVGVRITEDRRVGHGKLPRSGAFPA